jgi:hypothetical protein
MLRVRMDVFSDATRKTSMTMHKTCFDVRGASDVSNYTHYGATTLNQSRIVCLMRSTLAVELQTQSVARNDLGRKVSLWLFGHLAVHFEPTRKKTTKKLSTKSATKMRAVDHIDG